MPDKDEKKVADENKETQNVLNENKVFSVDEYRKKVGEVKTTILPSGAKFKIRSLSVMDYIKRGLKDIPNDFFKFITELSTGIGIKEKDQENAKKNYELFENFLKITVECGVIEPPIILRYDKEKEDTHLVFAELSQDDQEFLVKAITGKGTKW